MHPTRPNSILGFRLVLCVLGIGVTPIAGNLLQAEEQTPAANTLQAGALRSLETYCYDCHAGEGAEGGIQIDLLDAKLFQDPEQFGRQSELVEKVVRALREQQMPPADAEQPTLAERLAVLDWTETRLEQAECLHSRPGRVTLRRLNRVEYDNTIRDLTGLDLRLAVDFPSDDVGNGFDNIGDVLTLPPILMEKYLAAALRIAEEVLQDDSAFQQVFPFPLKDTEDLKASAEIVHQNAIDFASRAFRRPVTEEEAKRLFELMRSRWQAGAEREEILQTVLAAVLTSPHFLYRVEEDRPRDFVDGIRPLNDFELASRLSYFLWSSMPDERLRDLARRGKLHTAEQLQREARRMLADPKTQALVENFAGQWLQLRDLATLSPDPELFGTFDDALRVAMRRETELLFTNIMSENRSVLDILNADYTFLNERLATHYGMAGVQGEAFRKVQLDGQRRGALMHGSILLLTSNPTRTSPVKRGKWILDNLLGEPPPPPPPDVPELDEAGETLGTLRQQMELHRANPNCAICHTKMDALGFGLENFDAVGRWRDADGRHRVDPSGTLPGGRKFQGPMDLVQILAEDKKQEFCRCLADKLLTYALGRGLNVHDRCSVRAIVQQLSEDDYKFGTLIDGIVTSPQFMNQESGH